VIVSRISDPFRSALLDALLNEIQRQGFQALVSEIHSEQDLAHTLRRFAQFRVSGVIVTSGQPPEALVNECVQQHIPVVGINRQPTIPGVDYVCSDNAAAAPNWPPTSCCAAAVGALAGSTTHPSTWAGRMRGEAFSRALQTRGVDVERDLATSPVRKRATSAVSRPRRSPTRRWGIFAPTPSLPVAFSMECASAANRRLRITS
jgi:DNA-binding LacI/PurR family transcriptional regulator